MRQLTELVNNSQGFRIKGWFKPAVADNGVTQETFSLHACFLAPGGPLTEEQLHAVYSNDIVTVFNKYKHFCALNPG